MSSSNFPHRRNFRASLPSNPPALPDKTKTHVRKSTPDSEALISSDEDGHDHTLRQSHQPIQKGPAISLNTARRQSSSWLNDIQPNRKFSLGDVRRDGPSRLKEVVQSPTSGDFVLPSPTVRNEDDGEGGIGFLLNQNPVRKSVRSQSYSVGQQDGIGQGGTSANNQGPRVRGGGSMSQRNRPAKPSLLNDTGRDGFTLAQLKEDEYFDDIESSNGSEQGVRLPPGYWTKQEPSSELGGHALLKQAAVENARVRHRATTTGSPVSNSRYKYVAGATLKGLPLPESDYAIEELDDSMDRNYDNQRMPLTRRFSEHVSITNHDNTEDPIMDSPKKPYWASSTGYGASFESQSRRHSFADVPSHQSSRALRTLANTYEEDEAFGAGLVPPLSPRPRAPYENSSYFNGGASTIRAQGEMLSREAARDATRDSAREAAFAHPAPPPYPAPEKLEAQSPGQNPYEVPSVINRPGRRLFVVAFKCSRADVYYLPEDTGLAVKRGDLVVTEGDRGSDLGQVTHADVTLAEAKRAKEAASVEHFRWLMMFSRHAMAGNHTLGTNGSLALATTSAGGVGPQAPPFTPFLQAMATQHDTEIKPKLIRRIAQDYEIRQLRDKEGSEAKAKRICQAKVIEHNLRMEILDAEYQLDYKKLTFFYFAECYINFNDLVTDLFKIYKTRIWMSAINPASFASAAGLLSHIPPPSALGPGATIPAPLGPSFGSSLTAPVPVGLGFRPDAMRVNEQYSSAPNSGGINPRGEASRDANASYYPFANQLPQYPVQSQAQYGVANQWAPSAPPQPFNRYNPYSMVSGAYPPTTYPSPVAGVPSMALSASAYPSYYPTSTYSSSPANNAWVNQFQNMSLRK